MLRFCSSELKSQSVTWEGCPTTSGLFPGRAITRFHTRSVMIGKLPTRLHPHTSLTGAQAFPQASDALACPARHLGPIADNKLRASRPAGCQQNISKPTGLFCCFGFWWGFLLLLFCFLVLQVGSLSWFWRGWPQQAAACGCPAGQRLSPCFCCGPRFAAPGSRAPLRELFWTVEWCKIRAFVGRPSWNHWPLLLGLESSVFKEGEAWGQAEQTVADTVAPLPHWGDAGAEKGTAYAWNISVVVFAPRKLTWHNWRECPCYSSWQLRSPWLFFSKWEMSQECCPV